MSYTILSYLKGITFLNATNRTNFTDKIKAVDINAKTNFSGKTSVAKESFTSIRSELQINNNGYFRKASRLNVNFK